MTKYLEGGITPTRSKNNARRYQARGSPSLMSRRSSAPSRKGASTNQYMNELLAQQNALRYEAQQRRNMLIARQMAMSPILRRNAILDQNAQLHYQRNYRDLSNLQRRYFPNQTSNYQEYLLSGGRVQDNHS